MKSTLIKDTTMEERIALIRQWIRSIMISTGKNSGRKCSDGRHRLPSMKSITEQGLLFNYGTE